jgi:hypothetical protein
VKCPRCDTVSPRQSARITSAASCSRALRSGFDGQRSPVMCSFRSWPLPMAIQKRSGNISAEGGAACAMIAGW